MVDPEDSVTTSDIHIRTNYKNLKHFKDDSIGPIRICAFDIECSSSHGDFPQAIKTYSKLANDMMM